ncbi:MAG: hypothetical protein JG781_1239 [Peptococcaceae bacterium]|jgi:hypothetical protein|nr:hypothetical protein [Peptococcaceae bacterium]
MTERKPRIIVDADASPKKVREITCEIAQKYGWEVVTVASFHHQMEGGHQHIIAGDEAQAADLVILNLLKKGNIVVTQDWGLAALVLGKGGDALSPHGYIFREERMEFLLEERHLKAKYRRMGGRTRGPAARTKADDEKFRKALEKLVQERENNLKGN